MFSKSFPGMAFRPFLWIDMDATPILEAVGWLILSFLKFIIMPSTAIAAGLNPGWVFACSFGGAAVGVFLMRPVVLNFSAWRSRVARKRGKKVVTAGRRRIVQIKERFGLWGIAVLGGLVGVPVGAFLAFKYFGNRPETLPVMLAAYAFWSALLTTLSAFALI